MYFWAGLAVLTGLVGPLWEVLNPFRMLNDLVWRLRREQDRDQGRLAPEGLRYVASWVADDFHRCFQIMECEDLRLLEQWMERWSDLVDFEVIPVMTSDAAASAIAPRL